MENKNNNKQVQVFNSEIFGGMRVVMRDGEPWFAGKDVSEILAYKDTDKAVREHVDDEDKRIFKPADLAGLTEQQMNNVFKAAGYNWNFVPANIPNRGLFFINESGLYSLIMSSKLPQAKAFKRWVTSEVLPTIRKQGMYLTPATSEEAISNPESFIAKALIVANQVLERQKERIKHLETTNNALTSTISTTNVTTLTRKRTCATRNDMTVREVSKLLGAKQTEVYRVLRKAGWFMRAEEGVVKNVPTLAAPADCFYIEEYTYNHNLVHQVKVTKAGLLKIKSLL